MDWISVGEKLPDRADYFLVAWKSEYEYYICGEAFFRVNPQGWEFPSWGEEKDVSDASDMPVVHFWMEFPTPPRAESSPQEDDDEVSS